MEGRKYFKVLGSIFIVLTIAGSTFAQTTPKPIKLGVLYSLTGMFSATGVDTHNGVMTWIELQNQKGGIKGHPIQFVDLDDQSDPTKAALAAKKFIDAENVHAIVGSAATGLALAVGPVCEKSETPYVSAGGSEVFEQTLKPHWSFRCATSTSETVDWGLGALKLLDPKIIKLAVLYQGHAVGKASYDNAARYAPMRGMKIVAVEKYDPNGTEFGAQIMSIIKANPDAVGVYGADMAGPLAIKQMREMGMNKPIITLGAISMKATREAFKDTFSIPPYVYSAGQKADVWGQLPRDTIDYKTLAPIAMAYEKKYNDQYTWFQQLGVNNVLLTMNSVERALNEDPNLLDRDLQTIRASIRNKIETVKDLQCGGIMTCFTPKNHNVLAPGSAVATFHFEKGKIVYDPQLSKIKLNPPPPLPD